MLIGQGSTTVLGANDGLLSNFSLVMGVAAASLTTRDILITGRAGLLAGAGSMAMGGWISVQSSRELYGRQIAVERQEIEEIPEEEQEELGIDPEELGGSAWAAAATSFFLFAIGAIIPVTPFLLFTGQTAVLAAALAGAAGLFGIGAAITLFTGRSVLLSGTRQVLVGAAAAALTYGLGNLLGVAIS